jgi:hypothetical protein
MNLDIKLPFSVLVSIIVTFFVPVSIFSQSSFRLSNASKNVDVVIEVGSAPNEFDLPSAKYKFFRKGAKKPFQIVSVKWIDMWDTEPKANSTVRYDDQSVVNFGDFNFDGVEDVALNDGKNGGYGMPSYQVYLYSTRLNRYALSKPFTRINQDGNLGFMEVDRKKKMLYRYTKSGCCWHQTEGFIVENGVPRRVYEYTEDAMDPEKPPRAITRKLVHGKWRTWVRRLE